MAIKPIVDIVLPRSLWGELRAHLLRPTDGRGHPDEQMAFILAGPLATSSGVRLLGSKLLLAGPADLAHQSVGGIGPRPEFVAQALTACRQDGWSLVEVHSHPFDDSEHTRFSSIDWNNDRAKMPALEHAVPHHATMVLGRRSQDAHYWWRDGGEIVPVSSLIIVGTQPDNFMPREVLPITSCGVAEGVPFPLEERHARHADLFGPEGQHKLGETAVAIVGLGGLGSFLALELAYLGVKRLVLVDSDHVEVTNLNRLIGCGPDDVGRPKVDVYAEQIRRVAPECEVVALAMPLLDAASRPEFKEVDFIGGCVDNHGARLTLNHIAMRYVIPLVDLGTGIRITDPVDSSSSVIQSGGQVQVVVPGGACLECRGMIDPQLAAFDLASPLQQQYERDHGYGIEEPAPSVIHLNGVIASLAAGELLRLIVGDGRQPWRSEQMIVYDALNPRAFAVQCQGRLDCVTCGDGAMIGVGDLAAPAPPAESALLRSQFQMD